MILTYDDHMETICIQWTYYVQDNILQSCELCYMMHRPAGNILRGWVLWGHKGTDVVSNNAQTGCGICSLDAEAHNVCQGSIHHYTTSCLNHSYKALCIHAFMLTSNSDPAVQMWQQKVRLLDQPAVQVWRALICSWEEGHHCNPLRYHSSPFLNWGPWPRTLRCQFFSGPRLSTTNCCGVRWRSLLSEVNKKLLLSKSKNKIS